MCHHSAKLRWGLSYFGVLRVLELVAGKHCETKWLGTDMRGWIPGIKGCLGARY